jgi:hypothetical protein
MDILIPEITAIHMPNSGAPHPSFLSEITQPLPIPRVLPRKFKAKQKLSF